MELPAALTKKLGPFPAWVWIAAVAVIGGAIVMRRRAAAAAAADPDAMAEDPGGYTNIPEPYLPGGGFGVGDPGYEFDDSGILSALENLAQQLGGQFGTLGETIATGNQQLQESLDTNFATIGAQIRDGYNTEAPPDLPNNPAPPSSGPPGSGAGNGQLPPVVWQNDLGYPYARDPKEYVINAGGSALVATIDQTSPAAIYQIPMASGGNLYNNQHDEIVYTRDPGGQAYFNGWPLSPGYIVKDGQIVVDPATVGTIWK